MLFASLSLWAYLVWKTLLLPRSAEPEGEGQETGVARQESSIAANRRSRAGHHQPVTARSALLVAAVFLLAWMVFTFVSTPIGSQLLRRSLVQNSAGDHVFSPEYILVASMGYLATDDPATNVLNDGTALRVAAAAHWHHEHPAAFVVMQGSSGASEPEDHQARLMASFAASLGVAKDKILLEPLSRNTREHARNLAEFPGITPETRIGVVTSDWHTRRTVGEFRAIFENVAVRPAQQREIEDLRLAHFLPREGDLHASSRYLREWLALAYYRLTAEN